MFHTYTLTHIHIHIRHLSQAVTDETCETQIKIIFVTNDAITKTVYAWFILSCAV